MLFASFRDAATAEERRRLAREMHDGIAQDIASLGYLVDGLAVGPMSPEQEVSCGRCASGSRPSSREVRRSVRTLRTDAGGERKPGRRHRWSGPPSERELGDPHPGHRRRAHRPAPAGGRVRAAADRPGVHEQRRPARPALADRGPLLGRGAGRRDRGPATTAGHGTGATGLLRTRDHARASTAHRSGPEDRRMPSRTAPSSRSACRRRATRPPGRSRPGRPEGERMSRADTDPGPPRGRPRPDPRRPGRRLPARAAWRSWAKPRPSTEALAMFHELRPDVVVTDLQLPDGTGLDVVREVRRSSRTPARGADHARRRRADLAAMEAGASAFVGKDAPSSEVVKAARHAAVSPRSFLCAGLTEAMLRAGHGESPPGSPTREHEVLVLLAEGLSAGDIGAAAPPERVDGQVARRPDLPEARRRQPRPGAGGRDAHGLAIQRGPDPSRGGRGRPRRR